MSLWAELKRRNVFRVAAAYVVAAWLLLQAGDILLSNFATPGSVFKSLVVLMSLGFPIILVFSFGTHSVTPPAMDLRNRQTGERQGSHCRRLPQPQ